MTTLKDIEEKLDEFKECEEGCCFKVEKDFFKSFLRSACIEYAKSVVPEIIKPKGVGQEVGWAKPFADGYNVARDEMLKNIEKGE